MMMTLEQVRSTLDEWGCSSLGQVQISTELLRKMRDAIDAHLTQPARSMDVEKVREVIAELREKWQRTEVQVGASIDYAMANKLTAALQEKDNG